MTGPSILPLPLSILYDVFQKDMSPPTQPKRPRKTYRVKFVTSGQYLTFKGETIWKSHYSAVKALTYSIYYHPQARGVYAHEARSLVLEAITNNEVIIERT